MPHATAKFNSKVIAEADNWEFVEGNIYFPPTAVNQSFLSKATLTTHCPWKGDASYYNISVDGVEAKDAAWYYASPTTDKASKLKNHVAFYKSKVEVVSE